MNKIDSKNLLKNQNKWIAISSNKKAILTSGKSIKEIENKLTKLRVKDAIISFVPPANKYLSPLLCL
ncbi:MAG: hypothetical protein HYV39_03620 [Candidatus Levybacteria bacterium]|nr:hypothetical protein [Candidatus Levybacteria bacterium]